jgi:hypothetical protein
MKSAPTPKLDDVLRQMLATPPAPRKAAKKVAKKSIKKRPK